VPSLNETVIIKKMKHYVELITWTVALLVLFFADMPGATLSFCLFKFIGFNSCFGCGIGHAIHHALHFRFQQSLQEHILGIPATIGIIYTIFTSLIRSNKLTSNGSTSNAYDAA
jgi:hypothetical protein